MSTLSPASPTWSANSQHSGIFTKIAERPFFQVAAGAALIGTAYGVYALSIQAFSALSGVFFPLLSSYLQGSVSFWTLHSIEVIGQMVSWVVEHQFVVFCASYLILPAEEQEGIQKYMISAGKAVFCFLNIPGTVAFAAAGAFFRRSAKHLPNAAAGMRDLEIASRRLWGEFVRKSIDTPTGGSPASSSAS